jgi:uncharacterized protein
MSNIIDWVEIPVLNMKRAKAFYMDVFKQPTFDMAMEGMEYSVFNWDRQAPGASGALAKSPELKPGAGGVVVYFSCEDVTVELARVVPAGGKIVSPKMAIGENGFIAHLIDSEGNHIALHSWK